MTSGNLSEEPIVSVNEEAWPRLQSLADHFLFHNRNIQTRVDDSVVQTFEGRQYPLEDRAVSHLSPSTSDARCVRSWLAAAS